MRRFWVLMPVLSLFLVAACGDDDGGGGGNIPLNEMEQAYQQALCDALVRCPPNGFVASFDGDADACYDFLSGVGGGDFQFDYVIDLVNAGNASYDPAAARECVDAISNATCEQILGEADQPEACEDAITGLVAEGGTCRYDEECASGWCDLRASCPGTCAATVAEGGDCSGGEACDKGLTCQDGTCVTDPGPAGNGESCEDRGCAYGLYCDWNAVNPVCAPRGTAGAACDEDEQCDYGMVCNELGQCAEARVVGAGEACDPMNGVFCSLADNLSCAMDMVNETATTCEPFRQEGESCLEADMQAQTATYYACDMAARLYCDIDTQNYTGVCAPQKADGQPCDQDQECLSGYCDANNVCASYSDDPCAQ